MKSHFDSQTLRRIWAWGGVMIVGALLYGWKIGMPLTDGDTAFYARIARNMIESGEWQTLRFKDYALIDKPPLTLWLIAVSYLLFGVSEAAIRGWHVLMAIATVVVVERTARLFYSPRTASLSGWILLTSALFVYCGMVPQQDLPLTFFTALGFYGFARFLRGDGWRHTYTFWIACALGVLARGMQAFVLPVAVAGVTLLYSGRRRWRAYLQPWTRAVLHVGAGVLLFAFIAVPWFVLEYRVHGEIFFDTFFGEGNRRFFVTGESEKNLLRDLAYVPLLLLAFLPWSGVIGHALWAAGRSVLRRNGEGDSVGPGAAGLQQDGERGAASGEQAALRRNGGEGAGGDEWSRVRERLGDAFFFIWFLFAFGMPWLIHWRVIRYLLPAIPPLAVLSARYLAPYLEKRAEGIGPGSRVSPEGAPSSGIPGNDASAAGGSTGNPGAAARPGVPHPGGMRVTGVTGIIVLLLMVALGIAVGADALPAEQLRYVPLVIPPLVALAVSLLVFGTAGWLRRYRLAVYGLVAGGILTSAVFLHSLESFIVEVTPWKEAAAVVNQGVEPGQRVIWADGGDNWFLDFYVDRWVDRSDEVMEHPEALDGAWLIGTAVGVEAFSDAAGVEVEEVWERGDLRVGRVRGRE